VGRSLVVLLVLSGAAVAGVYTPDDPCPFHVKPDGTAEPFPHNLFVAQLVDRLAPRVPNSPTAGILDWEYSTADGVTAAQASYAARLGQRLAARWPKAQQLRGDDLLAHSAALLRFNAAEQAINLLDRGRVGRSYALKMNRTHAFATARQWADALTNLPDEPEEAPPAPAGTSPDQFRWERAVDQGAYRRWLELRDAEAVKWKSQADTHPEATPFPLFVTAGGEPVRFWESADEAKKLPPDAVAVLQQLLLWAPWDDRLLWTLAEVYYASGRVRDAHSAYRMLVLAVETNEGRGYRGPRLLGPRVARVAAEFAKLPPEDAALPADADAAPAPPPEPKKPLVLDLVDPVAFCVGLAVLVGGVALMVYLQVRAIRRRRGRGGRG
jgi:hypothetical protein